MTGNSICEVGENLHTVSELQKQGISANELQDWILEATKSLLKSIDKSIAECIHVFLPERKFEMKDIFVDEAEINSEAIRWPLFYTSPDLG